MDASRKGEDGMQGGSMGITEILTVIPHRYPFLLVDRVLEAGPDRIVALKNVSINEPHFVGHFPGAPVMPGVLIVEALAQAAACLILNRDDLRGRIPYLAGIDRFRFRRPVVPGDALRLEVEVKAIRGRIGKVWGQVLVADQLVAEGELTFALPVAPGEST